AAEVGVRADADADEQITAIHALTADAERLAVLNAGRNLDGDLLAFQRRRFVRAAPDGREEIDGNFLFHVLGRRCGAAAPAPAAPGARGATPAEHLLEQRLHHVRVDAAG